MCNKLDVPMAITIEGREEGKELVAVMEVIFEGAWIRFIKLSSFVRDVFA